jgi:hypothetical protein
VIDHDLVQRVRQAVRAASLQKEGAAIEPSALAREDDEVLELPETLEEQIGYTRSDETKDRPLRAGNLFQHHDAHPYVLGVLLLHKYGVGWMEWEPETIVARILHDFKTSSVSDLVLDKIQAVKTLHYTESFWTRWEVFIACAMPFTGFHPDFDMMQVPTATQCAVAVHIANKLRANVPWSDEVKGFIATAQKFDGVLCTVEPLEFAPVDSEGHWVDCEAIRKRWPAVRDSGVAPTKQTVEDEQLRRLLAIHLEVKASDKRLQEQMRMVFHA